MITQAEIYTPIMDKVKETEGAAELGLWDDKIAFVGTDKAAKKVNQLIQPLGVQATVHYKQKGTKAKVHHIDYMPLIAELDRAELMKRIQQMQAQEEGEN